MSTPIIKDEARTVHAAIPLIGSLGAFAALVGVFAVGAAAVMTMM